MAEEAEGDKPRKLLPGEFAIDDNNTPDKFKKKLTIHDAAQRGLGRAIMQMIEKNIDFDINQRDQYGRTALHWSSEVGHIDATEVLVDLGSDLFAVENSGRTAIHLAARHGNAQMLRSILEGVEEEDKLKLVNQADLSGITPIFLAREKGKQGEEAFSFLMLCGAKYNQQSYGSSVSTQQQ
eukprot:TRINITY_DN2187_c0_g1_i1.p1 TRINITY_DN2187_c0_g1~~TRINITY_DN2187_c0_g1_i1.p1  ORF type:complete len:181 (-),score=44.03 TRINITY_DN2187_c0_g1_i1:267-809(-)